MKKKLRLDIQLELDLPALEKLSIFGDNPILERVKFLYPDQINHLSIKYFEEDVLNFQNLKILYCCFADDNLFMNLTRLGFLQELHCVHIDREDDIENDNDMNLLPKEFEKNFKFFISGFQVKSLDDLDNYLDDYGEIKTKVIALNLFDPTTKYLPWVHKLDYNKLIKYSNFQLDFNFAKKFRNLKMITARHTIKDVDEFIKFIQLFNHLKIEELQLEHCLLPLSFYEQLSTLTPFLDKLYISENFELNLEFLNQLEELYEATIKRQPTPTDLIFKLIHKKMKYFSIAFLLNGRITVFSGFQSDFMVGNNKFRTLEEVFGFLKEKIQERV